jgi:ubiquinone/menaquinone biosynthesis C-methylase UbiE
LRADTLVGESDVVTRAQNSVRRFDDRADDYVRYRPSYPPRAIDAMLEGLGPPGAMLAADVGAGTGISARLVADRGLRVIAVEPGEAMRGAASPHPRVDWLAATAEATALRAQAVDLVVCAQSFHWFRPLEALAEFARVLKPSGRLALVWNRRSRNDPFTAAYRETILDVGGESEAERMPFDPAVVGRSGRFAAPVRQIVPNAQQLDLHGLIGRARSASYAPKTGAAGDRLIASLGGLHAQYADASGIVTLVYDTEIFLTAPCA